MDIIVKQSGAGIFADWGKGARRCAIGRGGIAEKLREGDGITPVGAWPLRRIFYRADRVPSPQAQIPAQAIAPSDAWCDIPGDPQYNQSVSLPHASIDECLWRADHVYDLLAVVGFNDAPIVSGKGSAILLHLARADYGPTEGCVAFALADLQEALAQFGLKDRLIIQS